MTTDADITQADREMLAVEYDRDGWIGTAKALRANKLTGVDAVLRAIAAARIAATPKPKMPCGVPGGCDDPERCASEGQCHYGWSPDQDRVATVAGILTGMIADKFVRELVARTIVAGEARGYDTAPPVAPAPNEAPAFTAEMFELLSCLSRQVRWLLERRQSSDGDMRAMTIEVRTGRAFPSDRGRGNDIY